MNIKNIVYNTTRQWNPGDEFILFGIRNLFETVFGETNSIIFNRNPDIRPMDGHTVGLRNIKLPLNYTKEDNLVKQGAYLRIGFHDNSIKFDSNLIYADLAVFAGTPEWISHRCLNFFEHIINNNMPVMIIGVGYLDNGNDLIREICSKALVATVRDESLLSHELAKDFGFQYLPCPALFSAGLNNYKKIKKISNIALSFGLSSQYTVVDGTLNEDTFNYSIDLFKNLINKYSHLKFSFICHYIDEIEMVYKIFGKHAKVYYSYDAKDYINIYAKFDFVISTRVHGCGMSSSLGIPNINIAHDGRAGTCKGFLSEQIDSKTKFIHVFEKIDFMIKNIKKKNKELISYKQKMILCYIKLLKGVTVKSPIYVNKVSYSNMLNIQDINPIKDNIIFDKKWLKD